MTIADTNDQPITYWPVNVRAGEVSAPLTVRLTSETAARLSSSAPSGDVRIQYRLAGSSGAWLDLYDDPIEIAANAAAVDYQLRVDATNADANDDTSLEVGFRRRGPAAWGADADGGGGGGNDPEWVDYTFASPNAQVVDVNSLYATSNLGEEGANDGFSNEGFTPGAIGGGLRFEMLRASGDDVFRAGVSTFNRGNVNFMDYAFRVIGNDGIQVYELGNQAYFQSGAGVVQAGDFFEIRVGEDSEVTYWRVRGAVETLLYTSTVEADPDATYYADVSLRGKGFNSTFARVENLQYYSGERPPTPGDGFEEILWANAVGVDVSGNSHTATVDGFCNAGASSQQAISAAGGGVLQIEITEVNAAQYLIAGLTNSDDSQCDDDADFGLFFNDGVVEIKEGADGYLASDDSVQVGDLFEWRVAPGGAVTYYRVRGGADLLLYTSTQTASGNLYADTALGSIGATVSNARTRID